MNPLRLLQAIKVGVGLRGRVALIYGDYVSEAPDDGDWFLINYFVDDEGDVSSRSMWVKAEDFANPELAEMCIMYFKQELGRS